MLKIRVQVKPSTQCCYQNIGKNCTPHMNQRSSYIAPRINVFSCITLTARVGIDEDASY